MVNDVASDPVFGDKAIREMIRGDDVRSVLSMPLITSAGELVGVISIHCRASRMPSSHQPDLTYIQDVADHLAQFNRRSRK